jgi:putative DNA primase/helicase
VLEPWQRKPSEFRHPQLKAWTAENRSKLLEALLTLGRRWFVKGCPQPAAATPTIGSFEEWSRIVGGVLHAAEIEGFLGNAEELYRRSTDDASSWETFLGAWFEVYGSTPKTTKQLAEDLYGRGEEYEALRDALPDEFGMLDTDKRDSGFTRKLGNAFSKREHVRFGSDGLRLERAGEDHKVLRWRVVRGGPHDVGTRPSL